MPEWWDLGGLAVPVLPFTMVGGRWLGKLLKTSNIIVSRHKIRTLSNVIPFSHESCQLASKSFYRCLTIVMTNSFCCFLFFIHKYNTIITNCSGLKSPNCSELSLELYLHICRAHLPRSNVAPGRGA